MLSRTAADGNLGDGITVCGAKRAALKGSEYKERGRMRVVPLDQAVAPGEQIKVGGRAGGRAGGWVRGGARAVGAGGCARLGLCAAYCSCHACVLCACVCLLGVG